MSLSEPKLRTKCQGLLSLAQSESRHCCQVHKGLFKSICHDLRATRSDSMPPKNLSTACASEKRTLFPTARFRIRITHQELSQARDWKALFRAYSSTQISRAGYSVGTDQDRLVRDGLKDTWHRPVVAKHVLFSPRRTLDFYQFLCRVCALNIFCLPLLLSHASTPTWILCVMEGTS